jgi:hypothetical protein
MTSAETIHTKSNRTAILAGIEGKRSGRNRNAQPAEKAQQKNEEGRGRALDVFAGFVDKAVSGGQAFSVAISDPGIVELEAGGPLDIDPDRGRKHEDHGQQDPVLGQQRRRGEDEKNPRRDLVTDPLSPTERQFPCQMHAGSVVVPPELEVVVPPELEVVVSPELEVVVVPPVLVEFVDVLASTLTRFV